MSGNAIVDDAACTKALVDIIAAKDAEIARLRAALEWYGENARLVRLIHSEGDKGRKALDADGGSRARAALSHISDVGGKS